MIILARVTQLPMCQVDYSKEQEHLNEISEFIYSVSELDVPLRVSSERGVDYISSHQLPDYLERFDDKNGMDAYCGINEILLVFYGQGEHETKVRVLNPVLEGFKELRDKYIEIIMVKVGDRIMIVNMKGEPHYSGKTGVIKSIDDIGQLHGTWGGLAVSPDDDEIIVL